MPTHIVFLDLSGCDHKFVSCTLRASDAFSKLGRSHSFTHLCYEDIKDKTGFQLAVFSSLFLSVICFAGLIHVEIELQVHRQMLQVLNQPKEEKLELRNTVNENCHCLWCSVR